MSSIIFPEQSCVPGRDIIDNIMSVRDVIDLVTLNNKEGFLIKLDQEKAFDRVSHSFMFKVLNKLNFGNTFISWIKILYNDIKSTVKINGHLTHFFPICRGVRQGCPISMLLYVIVAEPLNILIKNQQNIKGININNDFNALLFQHADDTSFTVQDPQSVENVFHTVNTFCLGTGAKVNIEKSEVLCLGKSLKNDITFKISVTVNTDCVQILGVYLGPNKPLCERLNWKPKIDKLNSLINLWKQRKLTLNGKATVWNTLLTSRMWYIVNAIHVPKWVTQEIQKMFCKFMWDNKIPLINYSTIIGGKHSGGLNIQDLSLKKAAFRLKLLKKYFNSNFKFVWKHTMTEFLCKYMNMNLSYNIFNIVYDESALEKINPFYAEVLSAWDMVTNRKRFFPLDQNQILDQPLFHNPFINYKGKLLCFDSFIDSGVITLADITYEVIPGFLPLGAIVEMIKNKCPQITVKDIHTAYNVILYSLPPEWKELIVKNIKKSQNDKNLLLVHDNGFLNVKDFTVKQIYSILIAQNFKLPSSIEKWNEKGFNMSWKSVWKTIHSPGKSSDHVNLEFKIAHNIILTYSKLFKYGLVPSRLCPVCLKEEEDICHLFLYCDELYNLISVINEMCICAFKETGFSLEYLKSLLLFGCYRKIQCL